MPRCVGLTIIATNPPHVCLIPVSTEEHALMNQGADSSACAGKGMRESFAKQRRKSVSFVVSCLNFPLQNHFSGLRSSSRPISLRMLFMCMTGKRNSDQLKMPSPLFYPKFDIFGSLKNNVPAKMGFMDPLPLGTTYHYRAKW